MKKNAYIIFLLLFSFEMVGQNAYYSALKLGEYCSMVDGKVKIQPDNRSIVAIGKAFKKYIPSMSDGMDKKTIDAELQRFFRNNPNSFISYGALPQDASLDAGGFNVSSGGIGRSLGGLNVTKFADGLEKFLVDRTKEELSIVFFEKFKSELDSLEELSIIFPKTHSLLKQIDEEIYNISGYLNMLKETFRQDLKTIIPNLRRVLNSDNLDEYFVLNPTVKFILNEALIIAEELQNGTHPGDIINRLKNEADDEAAIPYYQPSLETIDLISQSLRSKQEDRYWVPADSVKLLIKDEVTLNIYLGLLYQQSGDIKFDDTSLKDILKKIKESGDEAKQKVDLLANYINELSQNAQRVDQALKAVKASVQSEIKNYENHFQFYSASIDLLENAVMLEGMEELSELVKPHIQKFDEFLAIARTAGDLYLNITQKKYFSAVLDLNVILSDGVIDDAILHQESVSGVKLLHKEVENIKKKTTDKGVVLKDKVKSNEVLQKVSQLIITLETIDNKIDIKSLKQYYKSVMEGSFDDLGLLVAAVEKLIEDEGIKELSALLEPLTNQLGEFPAKLMKYGNLAAGIAEAENSDEVKKLIAAVALPSGSASIKRKSKLNVSLNAYVGPSYSYEKLNQGPVGLKNEYSGGLGLSAPVGIALSSGTEKGRSHSLFISLIDIGALASFRFNVTDSVMVNDPNGNGMTMAAVSELPEIRLENILAPGAYYVHGFKGLPISAGLGVQYSPQLRKVELTLGDPTLPQLDVQSSSLRFQVFLAVDIPLLNFYNRGR